MTFFWILVSFVILQRLLEVLYARFNEKRMKAQGAIEAGASHYKWIVMLHLLFFFALIVEVSYFRVGLGKGWLLFLTIFIVAQLLRVWTLSSLGPFWNTKILVLPGAERVSKGPYRYMSHPNYIVVALELASLPLIFGAYWTAVIFTLANALLLLFVRIPAEEKALLLLDRRAGEK